MSPPVPRSWPPTSVSRWSMMLPKDAPAVRTARSAIDEWLCDAPARVRQDARSIVTELVSNAVRYGEPPIQLRVERLAGAWRIDVADAGAHRPRRGRASHAGGWGLHIVSALADSWGVAENASCVWCVLRP